MTITPEKIAELRALLGKATPGPWCVFVDGDYASVIPSLREGDICVMGMDNRNAENADLIAALRSAAPALLDEIEWLRNACDNVCRVKDSVVRDCAMHVEINDALRAERDRYRDMAVRLAKEIAGHRKVMRYSDITKRADGEGGIDRIMWTILDNPDIAVLLKEAENG